MSNKNPYIFFGSSEFSLHCLNTLEKLGALPVAIVTLPDAPQGRGRALQANLVRTWALSRHIPCIMPESLRDEQTFTIIKALADETAAAAFLVASYGKLLPKRILDIPIGGTLNIHPSLLPQYRGPSPIQSIILDDARSAVGISIMLMDEQMDHGPILAAYALTAVDLPVWPLKASELEVILARYGAELFVATLEPWLLVRLKPIEQDHRLATTTHKFVKTDGLIDINSFGNGRRAFLTFCALERNPGVHFLDQHGQKEIRVKVVEAVLGPAGEFLPIRVVPEGRKAMDYADYVRGKR